MIQRGTDGFYHPASEQEVSELIEHAAAHQLKIRVRGSAHSVSAAIYADGFEHPGPDEQNLNIVMEKMRGVHFDRTTKQVTVEAGCHLGVDPADPTRTSTLENSLLYQIDQQGWALSDTGGIIFQTVGGFLSTGSEGGSLHHSVGRQIVAIRLVDGLGKTHAFYKSDNQDDPFFAAGVSMGLLGVITSVTFQCVDRFAINGIETTSTTEKCKIDLFSTGKPDKPDLEAFLRSVQHTRLNWFPQKGANKIIVWEANHVEPVPADFTARLYHVFPVLFNSEIPAELATNLLFRVFDFLNPPSPKSAIGQSLRRFLEPLYAPTVNFFLASAVLGPQHFQDLWWHGLPMDNRVDYNLINTQFTELWFPLDRTAEVMRELRAYFQEGGFDATGTYSWELYCSPSSHFWMSPAYQRDVFRVDPFWFALNRGHPDLDFFPGLWERLKKFDYRLHWGKYLIKDAAYLRQQYPRWDDFMALREQFDPNQIFVTDYWRTHLGISPAVMASGT